MAIFGDLFQSFELAVNYHPYQREALETLVGKILAGERQLHLVAPPGSGKTLIGLELARRIGQKTVILSPTTPIQQQWVDKFSQLSIDLEAIEDLPVEQTIISTDLEKSPAILSLTYQAFSIKGQEGQFLHRQVEKLFVQLAEQGYHTLLLDECHHLLAHWAAAIQVYLQKVPEAIVIGLTATPPLDRKEKERAVYLDLIGPVDFEVPTPAVIKEGHLAPFQDLVYLVRPTEAESNFVSGAHQALHRLLKSLETPHPDRPQLSIWAEDCLLHPTDRKGNPIKPTEFLIREPDVCIALVRYLYSLGIFPEGIPWSPEMEDPPSLEDLVSCLGAYGAVLLKDRENKVWNDLKSAVLALGYRYEQGRFKRRSGSIEKILALSAAKLRGLEQILLTEQAAMGEGLRALVLTDFETTHAPGGRAAEGLLDPEAGGALAVMRYLSTHPELENLHPLMVTGQTLLCNAQALPGFLQEAKTWFSTNQLEVSLKSEACDHFFRILGQGSDWKSSVYLALVTDFFEKGLSRCLVGTRGLLGEGWDCRSLNTLIDLTAVSSYVSVNQIRGRSLRFDPLNPLKLANNWDIVALLPELEGGFRDLERFQRKHQRFYGISEDGCLELGAGHVHALLGKIQPQELLAEMAHLNRECLERAQNRLLAWDRWGIGKPYQGKELNGLQLRIPKTEVPGKRSLQAPRLKTLPRTVKTQYQALELKCRQADFHLQSARILESLSLVTFWIFWPGEIGLGLSLSLILLTELSLLKYRNSRKKAWTPLLKQTENEYEIIKNLAQVTLQALQRAEIILSTQTQLRFSQRSDGSVRIFLEQVKPDESKYFSQSLQEIFEPLQEQRYLLEIPITEIEFQAVWGFMPQIREKQQGKVILPVPRLLARSREKAEIFKSCFMEWVGPADLIYTRQESGREKLMQSVFQRALPVQAQKLKIWE